MEGLISTFHIDWKLMVAQFINFGLVFCAFYLLAAKPLKKLIAERTDEITSGLENGKKNKELLANTEKEYQKVITKAKEEANIIFRSGKADAEAKKNEMLASAKAEVEQMITKGKQSLEAEKAKMLNDAKKEIVSLLVQTTEKVLSKKVPAGFEAEAVKELNSL